MFKQLVSFLVLANIYAATASVISPGHGIAQRRHYHPISRSDSGSFEPRNETESGLYPRGPNSRWSWYDTEETGQPGACGKHIKNSDFAVARPLSEFRFANDCFKQVTLTLNGRTAVATVMDACQACPPNGLDLSKGLFKHIAPNGDGIVFGSWTWGSKPAEEPKPKEDPPKKDDPPPKKDDEDTTTKKDSNITTKKPSSTKVTSTTTTTTTSPTTSASETTTAALAAPTDTFNMENNVAGIQDVFVRLGSFTVASSGKVIQA